jgi:hypothetical protein
MKFAFKTHSRALRVYGERRRNHYPAANAITLRYKLTTTTTLLQLSQDILCDAGVNKIGMAEVKKRHVNTNHKYKRKTSIYFNCLRKWLSNS